MPHLAEPLTAGTVVAHRFEVQGVLGRGGFGIVYRALDRDRGNLCALKELCPPGVPRLDDGSLDFERLGPEASTLRRLIRSEAEVLLRRRFPHVLSIRALVADLGTLYLASDYIDGAVSLDKWVQRRGGLGESGALDVLLPIAEALSAVHGVGLLHLDVKPSNVLVDPKGGAYLIDFGSARVWPRISRSAASADTFWATEGFAPPEVMSPEHQGSISPASDVFGLSATLYFAITGSPPPDPGHPLPLPIGASDAVREAIRLGLQVDPRHRPDSIGEWLEALKVGPQGVDEDWRSLNQKAEALRRLQPVGKGCPCCGEPMERPRPKPRWTCPACSVGTLHRWDLNPRRCPGCPTGVLHRVANRVPPLICPACARGRLTPIRKFPVGPVRSWRCDACPATFEPSRDGLIASGGTEMSWSEWRIQSGRSEWIQRCDECGIELDEQPDGSWVSIEPIQGHDCLLPDEWARVALGRSPASGEVECEACGAEYSYSADWLTFLRGGPMTPAEAVRLRGRPMTLESASWHAAGKTSGHPGAICQRCSLEFDSDGESLVLVRTRDARLREQIGVPATPDEWARLCRGLPLPEHEPDFWRRLDDELRRAFVVRDLPLYESREGDVLWDGPAEVVWDDKARHVNIKVSEAGFRWGAVLKFEQRPWEEVREVEQQGENVFVVFADGTLVVTPEPIVWEVDLKSGRRTIELTVDDLAEALLSRGAR